MKNAVVEIGVDEAGRGALAGPVVAGAVVWNDQLGHPRITDSKLMTPEQRAIAYEWIVEHCSFGLGIVSADVVDAQGILAATERAMQQAVEECVKCHGSAFVGAQADKLTMIQNFFLLVDGRDKFWFKYPHTSIIKGDLKEPAIAAASVVAKVTRDRLMIAQAAKYKVYGFESNKGYGSDFHCKAVKKHGSCTLHRQTFLSNIL